MGRSRTLRGATFDGVSPTTYVFTIDGELPERSAGAFVGMRLAVHDHTTVIEGVIRDQAELQGMILRISGLGLTMLSVRSDGAEGQ